MHHNDPRTRSQHVYRSELVVPITSPQLSNAWTNRFHRFGVQRQFPYLEAAKITAEVNANGLRKTAQDLERIAEPDNVLFVLAHGGYYTKLGINWNNKIDQIRYIMEAPKANRERVALREFCVPCCAPLCTVQQLATDVLRLASIKTKS